MENLTLVGLVLNPVGVILLFLYVIPKRVRTDGILLLLQGNKSDQKLLRQERDWDLWSLIGILLQGVGAE
jgi:hypothetical protein